MAKGMQKYNGISVSKSSIKAGDEVTLSYNGFLANSGADTLYAHIGYGDNWEEKGFYPMNRSGDVYKAKIKVNRPGSLNICFKDNGDNWDNNYNNNYSFLVEEKKSAAKKKEASDKVSEAKAKRVNSVTAKKKTTAKKTTEPKAKVENSASTKKSTGAAKAKKST